MVTLLAIRHAPVDVSGICYGQLDVATKISAAEVRDEIHARVHAWAPERVWSSDASRCAGPAALLSEDLGVPHELDPRLKELAYGDWEGLPWDEIDQVALATWMDDWLKLSPPAGESVSMLGARVASWWDALPSGRHFLLAHAGVMHAIRVASGTHTWEETMGQPLDFLQAVTFARP